MALTLVSGPAVEPVTLADLKTHLRIDTTAEDVLLASLMLTARLQIEAALDYALITQTWTLKLDHWPRTTTVDLPLAPLQAVTAVRVKTAAGVPVDVPSTTYLVDVASLPPRLVWRDVARPEPGIRAHGIEIELLAGYGATAQSVPAPLRQAIVLLVAHWYEHRDPADAAIECQRMPDQIAHLLAPFRRVRL